MKNGSGRYDLVLFSLLLWSFLVWFDRFQLNDASSPNDNILFLIRLLMNACLSCSLDLLIVLVAMPTSLHAVIQYYSCEQEKLTPFHMLLFIVPFLVFPRFSAVFRAFLDRHVSFRLEFELVCPIVLFAGPLQASVFLPSFLNVLRTFLIFLRQDVFFVLLISSIIHRVLFIASNWILLLLNRASVAARRPFELFTIKLRSFLPMQQLRLP